MSVKIGINGFGRIGRSIFRAAMNCPELEIVAVNDLTDACTLGHLLKYDSVHGELPYDVEAEDGLFRIQGKNITVISEKELHQLPWREKGVDFVIESTGLFTDGKLASIHVSQGAKKVLVTAPAKNEDITIVMGVNQEKYDPAKHKIISCASCTTNCLAPVMKVLHKEFGIMRGLLTTVHSLTNDQQLLDLPHKDLRRARAAMMSIIPTTTGAAKAVAKIFPDLAGKVDGMSMRVPTPNVSVIDLVADLSRPVDREEVNAALKQAAEGELKNILSYCDLPLVSRDFNGKPFSSTIDALSTMVVDGSMVKVLSWYDNEWGYSNRVIDTIIYMIQKGF
ncbi:MAG TPA: type I glyceraldehyde-3-phosphate dehydrogenase [Desulfotomaculum sp.]|nr:MAG: Glyceraldehyde-3-phosphate dehydrogenase, type I [Desulfotomaculum sp. 46_80]KUK85414.1 MAG: Glyceraldehyde-3-phosphate dehydrogenase, type I [Desulfofundulus kuznetsovii]HAG09993.1 type I glyceraldehyde-3-phosphate dehydrogenase [Desulfotomaculum sp.]HBY03365.1 type I glyceraldehyde-3-phosphate dehydrogenase [Desulfotomaculum sp.]